MDYCSIAKKCCVPDCALPVTIFVLFCCIYFAVLLCFMNIIMELAPFESPTLTVIITVIPNTSSSTSSYSVYFVFLFWLFICSTSFSFILTSRWKLHQWNFYYLWFKSFKTSCIVEFLYFLYSHILIFYFLIFFLYIDILPKQLFMISLAMTFLMNYNCEVKCRGIKTQTMAACGEATHLGWMNGSLNFVIMIVLVVYIISIARLGCIAWVLDFASLFANGLSQTRFHFDILDKFAMLMNL